MKKAIIYSRVSSESQAENTSIKEQQQQIKEYCRYKKIDIVKSFEDVSTGGNTNREGYKRLKDFIKMNKMDLLIVYKFDRLHRSLKNLIIDKEELEEQNISLVSIQEEIDTSSTIGKLFFNMVGSFSEFEKDLINDRTRAGKKAKIQLGKFTAGKIPFGYRIEKSEFIRVEDAEAEKVKEAFVLKSEGQSLRKIQSKTGIPKSTVAYMLKNTAYIGKLEQEKGQVISIPRIVSTQLYNKVNTQQ